MVVLQSILLLSCPTRANVLGRFLGACPLFTLPPELWIKIGHACCELEDLANALIGRILPPLHDALAFASTCSTLYSTIAPSLRFRYVAFATGRAALERLLALCLPLNGVPSSPSDLAIRCRFLLIPIAVRAGQNRRAILGRVFDALSESGVSRIEHVHVQFSSFHSGIIGPGALDDWRDTAALVRKAGGLVRGKALSLRDFNVRINVLNHQLAPLAGRVMMNAVVSVAPTRISLTACRLKASALRSLLFKLAPTIQELELRDVEPPEDVSRREGVFDGLGSPTSVWTGSANPPAFHGLQTLTICANAPFGTVEEVAILDVLQNAPRLSTANLISVAGSRSEQTALVRCLLSFFDSECWWPTLSAFALDLRMESKPGRKLVNRLLDLRALLESQGRGDCLEVRGNVEVDQTHVQGLLAASRFSDAFAMPRTRVF